MMKFGITLKAAIRAVKFAIAPFACWPLPADAKPSDFWRLNLRWCILLVHLQCGCVILAWNVYSERNNFNAVMINVTQLIALFSNTTKLIICKVEAPRLQRLLAELDMFLKQATKEEMETIQFYVDKCSIFHLLCYISLIIGALFFIGAPAVLPQSLPGDDDLPFAIEPFWFWLVLYISESILILEVSSMLIVNYMYAALLWFVVARFEMNCREFRRATNVGDLRRCISKHQQLIEYTDQVRRTTRPMALHVASITLFSASSGGYMLTRKLPLAEVVKHCIYYFGSSVQFFILAWPADNLMDMSVKIGDSAYGSAWVGNAVMLKDIILIVRKTQFPIEIAYDGLLPAVSLSLFRVGMSATFSYVATLRAMADD